MALREKVKNKVGDMVGHLHCAGESPTSMSDYLVQYYYDNQQFLR